MMFYLVAMIAVLLSAYSSNITVHYALESAQEAMRREREALQAYYAEARKVSHERWMHLKVEEQRREEFEVKQDRLELQIAELWMALDAAQGGAPHEEKRSAPELADRRD